MTPSLSVDTPVAPARLAHRWGSLVLSRGGGRVGQRAYARLTEHPVLATTVIVLAIALVRSPLLLDSEFVYEEAGAYWAMTFVQNPVAFLFDPWIGYLTVVSRAAFLVARLVPVELVPAFLRALEAVVIAGVSAFFVSDRFASVLPDRRHRVAFAVALACLPTLAPHGSILNAQWSLATLLVGLSLTSDRRWYDYPLGVLAVLSGLTAAMAVGAFWLRRPDRLGVLLTILAAAQVAFLLTGERGSYPLDVSGLLIRLGLVGAMMAVLVLAAAWYAPRRAALAFLGLGVAVMLAGAIAWQNFEQSGTAERYFEPIWAAVAFVGVGALSRGKSLGAIVLAIMIVTTVTRPAQPPAMTDWASHATCIGGPVPCRVEIWPQEWSVTWPGDPAQYRRYPR